MASTFEKIRHCTGPFEDICAVHFLDELSYFLDIVGIGNPLLNKPINIRQDRLDGFRIQAGRTAQEIIFDAR